MRPLLVLALVAAGSPAFADPAVPSSVHARLSGTSAQLTARFRIDVRAAELARDTLTIELPVRGAVSGAVAHADGVTRQLALEPATDAAEHFDAIAKGESEGEDRAWAVALAASGRGSLTVSVASPRTTRLELDVELEAPTCFFRDARYVELPETWTSAVPRELAYRGQRDELDEICDPTGSGGAWLAFPDRSLAVKPAGRERVGVRAARLPLAGHDVARVELAIARELSEVPADLHTAIVVDASRSMTDDQRRAQRDVVAAYLRAAPHGQVQIIASARDARALLPDWADATDAAAAIDAALGSLAPRNGSNLDVALAEAGTWLERTHGTRRVIVFDDELAPSRLAIGDHAALAHVLPEGTLVHVVAIDDGGGSNPLERDDDTLFGELAQATQGMAMRAHQSLLASPAVDATLLARPISLDGVELHGIGWTTTSATYDCSLDHIGEGGSCAWTFTGDPSSRAIEVTGRIWGRPFTQSVEPDPVEARSLARALTASGEMPADLQAEIDRAAEAVNAVWSLFASWGGSGGYAEEEQPMWGMAGSSSYSGSTHCGGVITTVEVPPLDLAPQLHHVLEQCSAQYAHVELELELTLEEIVAVDAEVTGSTVTPAMHDCIVEATWQTMLSIPDPKAHRTVRVQLD
ncbi:MAG TPA: VWA domain-containing protein [Kofleriaceae bacterium]|nr:VWA domain-containing protein [Kofleriaceae bacterium]